MKKSDFYATVGALYCDGEMDLAQEMAMAERGKLVKWGKAPRYIDTNMPIWRRLNPNGRMEYRKSSTKPEGYGWSRHTRKHPKSGQYYVPRACTSGRIEDAKIYIMKQVKKGVYQPSITPGLPILNALEKLEKESRIKYDKKKHGYVKANFDLAR